MALTKSLFAASLAAAYLLGTLASPPPGGTQGQPNARLPLLKLQSDFHAANALGDEALLESIFAEDATFSDPGGSIQGRSAIVAAFSSGSGWGTTVNLVPSSKTQVELHGNTTTLRFECVLVDTGGADPMTVTLSSVPFGSQNPTVEIVHHSTATVEAVKDGAHWVIQSFTGSPGAMTP